MVNPGAEVKSMCSAECGFTTSHGESMIHPCDVTSGHILTLTFQDQHLFVFMRLDEMNTIVSKSGLCFSSNLCGEFCLKMTF